MKITVDESTINKAIKNGKLELAEWLILNNCPVDDTVYVQNLDIKVLEWLKSQGIQMSKKCLSNVLCMTTVEPKIVSWFIENGAIVDKNTVLSCISNHLSELFKRFVEQYNIPLTIEYFKEAVISENLTILDYLKEQNCPFDDSVVESAMKHCKKNSLKWLVINNKF